MPQQADALGNKDVEHFVDLPEYDLRRQAAARDPLAVIEGYKIEIYLRLANVLGIRMCPNCPRCNIDRMGCQDRFGCNMRPCGGVLGGASAVGGGTEHQGCGTPHFHGEVHLVNAYQYMTLADIGRMFTEKQIDLEAMKNYQEWVHKEEQRIHKHAFRNAPLF